MEGGAHWGVSVEQRHKCVKSTSQYISKGGKKSKGGGYIPEYKSPQAKTPTNV